MLIKSLWLCLVYYCKRIFGSKTKKLYKYLVLNVCLQFLNYKPNMHYIIWNSLDKALQMEIRTINVNAKFVMALV